MLLPRREGRGDGARIGPRIPMTVGPIVMGVGPPAAARGRRGRELLADVLPGMRVFGLGLALLVAPLTATVLAAAPDEYAGIASGVNNARGPGGLAARGRRAAGGRSGSAARTTPTRPCSTTRYRMAMICAVLLMLGGIVSWLTIRNHVWRGRSYALVGGRTGSAGQARRAAAVRPPRGARARLLAASGRGADGGPPEPPSVAESAPAPSRASRRRRSRPEHAVDPPGPVQTPLRTPTC